VPPDKQLRFRIGIHLGDVIEKTDKTVYGDGVNIAARVQTKAPPAELASIWDDAKFKALVSDPANNAPLPFDGKY